MQLKTGDRLGPYEIVALAGAGGMGEVYRARDSRLDRTVAIKVLPSHLASRSDLRQRFEREARAVSTLTHPHICTMYDIGESDGTAYLVMEYLEGETLAERLTRGPLPLQQVVRFGAEMCEALDAAHRRGIIHRDLKPGNIMLTKSGVKLLDFGLAKLSMEAPSQEGDAPTAQQPLTEEGTVLGTLQYMAPEQLEGREVDRRTDIFAAGAILYEMVTSRRAFGGNSRASLITAILHSDPPPVSSLQPLSPPSLERIIRPCLAKDPEHRWQTAHDVALQLSGLRDATSQESAGSAPRRKWSRLWILPALAGAIAGALLAAILMRPQVAPSGRIHLSLVLPPDQAIEMENGSNELAISRDGTKIAYSARTQSGSQLFIRNLAAAVATPLLGTEGASGPFFNPGGTAIGFFAGGRLKTVSLAGGGIADLGPSGGPGRGATWLSDGSMVVAGLPGGALDRLRSDGTRERLTKVAENEGGHNWSCSLPGEQFVLFTTEIDGKSFDEARIEAVDLKTKKRTIVLEGGMHPRFVRPDRLLFARADKLYSVSFDVDSLSISGDPVVVADPLLIVRGTGAALYDVADNGTIVFVPRAGGPIFDRRLVWADRGGRTEPLPLPLRTYFDPRISPNGRKLAVEIGGANDDIWVSDLERGTFSRLTFTAENMVPVWMADSMSVAFSRYRDRYPVVHVLRVDGNSEPQKLVDSSVATFPASVSADGRWLAAMQQSPAAAQDVVIVPLTGDRKIRRIAGSRFNETSPDLSPDGRWIAYASDQSGKSEVYVQSIEGEGEKTQLSTAGGTEPAWARSGGEIFYRSGDRMMAVGVTTKPAFSAAQPRVLFTHASGSFKFSRNYDVTPDGQRFILVERSATEDTGVRRIDVIVQSGMGRP